MNDWPGAGNESVDLTAGIIFNLLALATAANGLI